MCCTPLEVTLLSTQLHLTSRSLRQSFGMNFLLQHAPTYRQPGSIVCILGGSDWYFQGLLEGDYELQCF